MKEIKRFFEEYPEYVKCTRHARLRDTMLANQGILEEYQNFTPTTAIYPEERALEYLGLELANEAGEVAGKIKKKLRGDSTYQVDKHFKEMIAGELGDVMYPFSQLCNYLGLSIEEVIRQNMDKLKGRQLSDTIKGDGDVR
jgi:NTP pyrophosphatase (non-canonical NTP hydrolase)